MTHVMHTNPRGCLAELYPDRRCQRALFCQSTLDDADASSQAANVDEPQSPQRADEPQSPQHGWRFGPRLSREGGPSESRRLPGETAASARQSLAVAMNGRLAIPDKFAIAKRYVRGWILSPEQAMPDPATLDDTLEPRLQRKAHSVAGNGSSGPHGGQEFDDPPSKTAALPSARDQGLESDSSYVTTTRTADQASGRLESGIDSDLSRSGERFRGHNFSDQNAEEGDAGPSGRSLGGSMGLPRLGRSPDASSDSARQGPEGTGDFCQGVTDEGRFRSEENNRGVEKQRLRPGAVPGDRQGVTAEEGGTRGGSVKGEAAPGPPGGTGSTTDGTDGGSGSTAFVGTEPDEGGSHSGRDSGTGEDPGDQSGPSGQSSGTVEDARNWSGLSRGTMEGAGNRSGTTEDAGKDFNAAQPPYGESSGSTSSTSRAKGIAEWEWERLKREVEEKYRSEKYSHVPEAEIQRRIKLSLSSRMRAATSGGTGDAPGRPRVEAWESGGRDELGEAEWEERRREAEERFRSEKYSHLSETERQRRIKLCLARKWNRGTRWSDGAVPVTV